MFHTAISYVITQGSVIALETPRPSKLGSPWLQRYALYKSTFYLLTYLLQAFQWTRGGGVVSFEGLGWKCPSAIAIGLREVVKLLWLSDVNVRLPLL